MSDFNIPASKYSPEINASALTGIIRIEGSSYPENAYEFYTPVIDWIKTHLSSGSNSLTLDVQVDYFNTSSTKMLLDLLELLAQFHQSDKDVAVNWYYEEDDEDIREVGEELSEDIDLPFNLIPY